MPRSTCSRLCPVARRERKVSARLKMSYSMSLLNMLTFRMWRLIRLKELDSMGHRQLEFRFEKLLDLALDSYVIDNLFTTN